MNLKDFCDSSISGWTNRNHVNNCNVYTKTQTETFIYKRNINININMYKFNLNHRLQGGHTLVSFLSLKFSFSEQQTRSTPAHIFEMIMSLMTKY